MRVKKTIKANEGFDVWDEIASKPVYDFDGFMTEYTLWYNTDQNFYVCVFGDSDIYHPEDGDWDAGPFESYDEAMEWYNDYDTEDVESCSNIEASFDWISEAKNKGYTVKEIANMYRNETGKIPKDNALEFKNWVKNLLCDDVKSCNISSATAEETPEWDLGDAIVEPEWDVGDEVVDPADGRLAIITKIKGGISVTAIILYRDTGEFRVFNEADRYLVATGRKYPQIKELIGSSSNVNVESCNITSSNNFSNSYNVGDFNDTFLSDLLHEVHENYKYDNFSDVDVVDVMIDHVNMLIEEKDLDVPDNWKFILGNFVYNNYDDYEWFHNDVDSNKIISTKTILSPCINVTGTNWNDFLYEVEKQTGLFVDSAYRRRYDDWIELFDEYGNWFDAEVTKYSDGTYELVGSNISKSYQKH